MLIIKRKMTAEKIKSNEYLPCCQASLNSDGRITLRNFHFDNEEDDEIIILSEEETNAIFKLFSRIGSKIKSFGDLPF